MVLHASGLPVSKSPPLAAGCLLSRLQTAGIGVVILILTLHLEQSIAAAATTTALWPPLSSALSSLPLDASALLRSSKSHTVSTARAHHTASVRSKPAPPAVSRGANVNTMMSLPPVSRWNHIRNASPLAIFTQASATPMRSVTMANPLLKRPFSTATSRSFGVPLAMRLMSTYRPQSLSVYSATLPRGHIQLRRFGVGGISRTILASREAAANRNPNSATAQNAFYQALLKANMPAIIVERYQLGT